LAKLIKSLLDLQGEDLSVLGFDVERLSYIRLTEGELRKTGG